MKRLTPPIFLLLFLCFGSLQAQHLISSTLKGSRTKAQMQAQFGVLMQNGIRMYKITYTTPDVFGNLDTASGLLVLPVREGSFAYPLLAYMHGTVNTKTDVPSNLQGGWDIAAVFGGLGFISAAPDFLGLGEARGFHPYVHAASEASAGVDMLRAVREYAAQNSNVYLNDQLFITGYSQGGHAAAALHRDIEQNHTDEFTVTASAPMSGPYSISGEMKKLILSDQPYGTVAYLPFTALSYNMVYGIYDDVTHFFKLPYSTWIQQFYQGQISLATLNIQLITQLTFEHGAAITKYMMQDSIIESLANDPDFPANLALIDNDLTQWAPQAPTRLFYCEADDQVPYTNAIVADSIMNMLGAPDTHAISAQADADHGDCVEPAVIQAALFFAQYLSIEVGANEPSAAERIKVFPNPARESFRLFGAPIGARATLTDFGGHTLRQFSIDDATEPIDMSAMSSGVYWLHLDWKGGSWTGKVIVE